MASCQSKTSSAATQSLRNPNTAEELKRLTREWPHILNSRDPYFLSEKGRMVASTIAPDFRAVLDSYPHTMSWSELRDIWAQEHIDYPDCRLEETDCAAYVNEKDGTAKVYIEIDMKFVEPIDLKAVTELRWSREKVGRWVVRGFHLMRGSRENNGYV